MATSDIIAIWGAVTGTTGAVVGVANMRRDRPHLRVIAQIRQDSYKNRDPPALVVTVTNSGKQPVPISDIGLAQRRQSLGRVRKRLVPAEWRTLRYGEWHPPRDQDTGVPKGDSGYRYAPPAVQTVNPGDAITAWDWVEDAYVRTVRAFVRDVNGHVSWGPEISSTEMRDALASNEERARYYG